jgi:hypothetical protein
MTMRRLATTVMTAVTLLGFAASGEAREPVAPIGSEANISAEFTVIGAEVDGRQALIFRVPYRPGSPDLILSAKAQQAIAASARRAEHVQIIAGVDDAGVARDKVSIERAGAAHDFLVGRGVPASRIEITGPATTARHIDIVAVLPAAGSSGSSE